MALILFSAAFLSAAGAFDTDKAAFAPRVSYWFLISLISTLALQGCHLWLSRPSRIGQQWRLRLLGILLLFLPLTLVALLLCKALFGGPLSGERLAALVPGMTGIAIALQLLLSSFDKSEASSRVDRFEPAVGAVAINLADTLPLPVRGARIHALSAEDHYVRVYTCAGDVLIRMRLRDAVGHLKGVDGLRPHRSWWVARDSIATVERLGRRTVLTLADGREVPVSRNAAVALGLRLYGRSASSKVGRRASVASAVQ